MSPCRRATLDVAGDVVDSEVVVGDEVDPAALAALRSRTWSECVDAECAATRAGHVAVEMEPDEIPRCAHCGATLSPDALRRAGIKGKKA